MAFVGLRHPVFAPITTETDGAEPVYGKGVVIGRAIKADIAFKRTDVKLYGDDMACEADNTVTGGTVTLGTDDLSDEVAVAMLGETKGETGEIVESSKPAPYGGFGYLRVRRLRGVTSYIAYWLYKVQFARGDENASTKGESLEWQTPTVQGSMMGVYADDSGEQSFRVRKSFTTEKDAIAWLNGKAKIASA